MIPNYPSDIVKEMKANKRYIPRMLKPNEHLYLYKRYWIEDIGFCKVKDVFTVDDIEYYDISFSTGMSMYGVITYPIGKPAYEMLRNFTKIENMNIINNKKEMLYGAEIKYWFIVNNINFGDEEYSGFLDKLHTLADSKKYFIRRNKKKKEYEFIQQ